MVIKLVDTGNDGCDTWFYGLCRYENEDRPYDRPCKNCKKYEWRRYEEIDGKMTWVDWNWRTPYKGKLDGKSFDQVKLDDFMDKVKE